MTDTHQQNTASVPMFTPIAIVGMGALFPESDTLKSLWQLIRTGRDGIREVPRDYWNPQDYFDPDPKTPDHTYCHRGGFLNPVGFDPTRYALPPTILEATDTAQLLSLVVAQQALEDAFGSCLETMDRLRTSVIMGVTGAQQLVIPLGARLGFPLWQRALESAGVDAETTQTVMNRIAEGYVGWQENSFPGLLGNVVAGRMASRFDLLGTNCVVDAACASSLSALHMATMELTCRRSDVLVVGGVDTFNDIFMYMCFSKTPALSPTGDARPFAADADGTVIGEGVGVLVLKRLEDAEADGDRIYAVIRGIGTSSDGRSKSIYTPNEEGQARCLRDALACADVDAQTIELVEAHGTGTKVGDVVEFEALNKVYRQANSSDPPWCALGTIKSQIGHTKAAAGAAGLIKAALGLYHKVLPPTIKVSTPNPKLNIEASAFYLNTQPRPWMPSETHLRRAGVSSFGFGGSNFHVILEEYQPEKQDIAWDGAVEIVAWSALTMADLRLKVDGWQQQTTTGWRREQLAWEAWQTRQSYQPNAAYRLVAVFEPSHPQGIDWARVVAQLDQSPETSWQLPGVYYSVGAPLGKLGFLFPGQGSQYPGMGRDLACMFPEMFQSVCQADQTRTNEPDRLSELIYPRPVFTDDAQSAQLDNLTQTDRAQPAIGAISLGYLEILARFGVKPEVVAGHSYGEIVALRAAGMIDSLTMHRLSYLRGKIMADRQQNRGTMLAVRAPLDEVESVIRDQGIDVVLANRNAPDQGVVSGTHEAVSQVQQAFKTKGYQTTPLKVAAAFHSPLIASSQQEFRGHLDELEFEVSKTVPVIANTTGEPYPSDQPAIRDLLGVQLAQPVDFVRVVQRMYAEGVRAFVEVGPKKVLSGLVGKILDDQPHLMLTVDGSVGRRSGVTDLAKTLAGLAAAGYPVQLSAWETQPEQPRKPVMEVMLTGNNYRDPAKQPAAAHKVPENNLVTKSQTNHGERKVTKDLNTRVSASPHPLAKQPHVSSTNDELITNALQTVQEGLKQLGELQKQTAAVHQQFLKNQEQAQQTFQAMLSEQNRMVDRMLGITPSAPVAASMPVVAPSVAVPSVSPPPPPPVVVNTPVVAPSAPSAPAPQLEPIVLEVVAELTGYPAEMLNLEMDIEADLGIDSIKRVEILSALEQRIPEFCQLNPEQMGSLRSLREMTVALQSVSAGSAPEKPTPAPNAPAPSASYEKQLLEVVADLTGYPAEMLNLDMDLEADLGIDSIKRVEILSALQERVPAIEGLSPDQMGATRTLGAIVAALNQSAPPTPQPAQSSASSDQVSEVVYTTITQLTGYPREMLTPDMELEADLGIDSIKRVEIFSTLEQSVPEVGAAGPENLGRLKTLGEIAELLRTMRNAEPPTDTSTATVATTQEVLRSASLERSVLTAVPIAPLAATPIQCAPGYQVLVTDDETGLSSAIVDGLVSQKVSACLVSWGQPFADNDIPVGGVVLVAPPDTLSSLPWSEDSEPIAQSAFLLAQRYAPDLLAACQSGGALLASVTRMDGGFGLLATASAYNPIQGALAGLVKTAALEMPEVACHAIDVDPEWQDDEAMAEQVLSVLAGQTEREVGLTETGWYGLRCVKAPADPGQPVLSNGDVVVVTGGGRGITTDIALAIAKNPGVSLALLGRSPVPQPDPEWLVGVTNETAIKAALLEHGQNGGTKSLAELQSAYQACIANRELYQNLQRFESTGVQARYYSVDVRDETQLGEVFNTIRANMGPIRGLVHAAGVIADRRIPDKTEAQFERVFNTKVSGLRNLLAQLQTDELAALVLFSSISGRVGRVGQVDYAMANEVLNKTALRYQQLHPQCRSVAIGWGPWEGGMVTPALAAQFQQEGVGLIPLAQGAESMVAELCVPTPGPAEILIGVDLAAMHNDNQTQTPCSSTNMSVVFERELTLDQYPFIEAHVLNGYPVFPLAMMIEWLGHAALVENPGLVLQGIDGLRVCKGVVLNQPRLKVCVATDTAVRHGNVYEVATELRNGTPHPARVFARSKIMLSESYPTAPSAPTLSAEFLQSGYDRSIEEVYREILFHGQALQGLSAIEACCEQGVIAHTQPGPKPSAWMREPVRNSWIADPLIIDTGFQLGTLWCHEFMSGPGLPSYVEHYRQYREVFPSTPVVLVLEVCQFNPHRMVCTITVQDDSGQVIARMDGCEFTADSGLRDTFHVELVGYQPA